MYLVVYLVTVSSFWRWWNGELIYTKVLVQTTWKSTVWILQIVWAGKLATSQR